ncbi:sodium:calcium antiporter [Patescibacteria group bacterium]|nr:sodium:calcium antiporter [Patescibacteria group bacterium]MBU1868736.1 sodium:calcium antiporter [Patescibacteria group bacterium]
MLIIFHLLLLIISSIVLVKATTVIIIALEKMSRFLKLREFSIAFILMAIATSLPELFVGITSAIEGTPILTLGAVLGSNIVNLTLVTGIAVIASRGIPARSIIFRRDALYMAIYAAIPLILLSDRVLSRGDGVIILIFYGLYLVKLINQRSLFKKRSDHVTSREALYNLTLFIVSVVVLLISADVLVRVAVRIAGDFNIGLGLVGIIFIAIGTSLPELVLEIRAVQKQHASLALGDLVGSVVANSTLVLGIAAIISPIEVDLLDIFLVPLLYLFVILVIFEVFVRTDKKLVIWEGVFLFMMYIAFLLTELALGYLHSASG